MDPSPNPTQADIMRRMFEQDGLRFSEINTAKLPTDQFSYHLRQLMKAKLIEKMPDETYRLTYLGKNRTIMLPPEGTKFIQQGFVAVLMIVSQQRNGQEVFLAHQRNKVPNKGNIGFFGDKVRYGENTDAAARRTLTLQTGLTGKPRIHSIWHLIDKIKETVVEDKYFFIYGVTEFQGELQRVGITGENKWMTFQEMKSTGKLFHGVEDFIASMKSENVTYHEQVTEVESY